MSNRYSHMSEQEITNFMSVCMYRYAIQCVELMQKAIVNQQDCTREDIIEAMTDHIDQLNAMADVSKLKNELRHLIK